MTDKCEYGECYLIECRNNISGDCKHELVGECEKLIWHKKGRESMQDICFNIAHEAHIMGRVYNKMGEPENPAEVCEELEKMVETKIKSNQ